MSASDGRDPLSLFREVQGRTILEVTAGGTAALLLSIYLGLIEGATAVLEFLFLPFSIFAEVAVTSANAFLIEPLTGGDFPGLGQVPGVIQAGIATTSSSILALVGEVGATIGLPASVAIVLITFALIGLFLSQGFTSDIVPGIFVDNRVYRFFFTTPEEEEEGS